MVVEFLFERDTVFQLVDDIFKQGNVKASPYGKLVAFLELRRPLNDIGHAFKSLNSSVVSA